ncbi:peptidylprolyl isomerase [Caulobacter sp. NIBR2454]|uniref:peptidylprolyl isomerase n=1 Tax=Caulobacter sp. NIBR2454 TaxID=3015996 RepID=UPI0022B61FCF|nr:peptidylprolyl isomerase [Caulobacter sp. NIBR2454]
MLAATRKFAKSWVAAVLMGLLIISFAVFGISDVFNGRLGTWVIKAGDREVTTAEFKRMFDNWRQQAQQQSGQELPLETIVERGFDLRLLNEMATREAMAALIAKMGVNPSDKLIAAELRKSPALFNPVSGAFDEAIYQQRLAENGLTPAIYESLLRDDIAQTHLSAGLASGLRAPRIYGALQAAFMLEQRDVAYFDVSAASVGQPPAPTDAEIQAFMKENASRLTRPEFRVLQIVRFTPQAFAGEVTIDQAEVQKKFDFRKDSLSTPETRTILQVPVADAKTGAVVADRLRKGEDAAAVAKSVGRELVTIADKPKTAIPDRKVADAAFSLKAGEVSAPITGDLGVAVIKVVSVTAGRQASLEEQRPAIEAELRAEAANEKVYEQTQTYDEAHAGGATLVEAATKAKAQILPTPPVSAQGMTPDGQPIQLPPALMKAAFELPAGGESDVTELGNGEYFAVRVERIIPPALPALAEVREQLSRVIVMQRTADRMRARADALAERVRKGESIEAVAASAGAQVKRASGLSRLTAQQNQELSPQILGETFNQKPGSVFTAQSSQFAFSVAKVENVRGGDQAQMAQAAEGLRRQVTYGMFQDIGQATANYARKAVKVTTSLDRARAAIGVDPEIAKKAPAGQAAPEATK